MITSGSYGYRMQKAIALAYFRTPIADDDELEMEILGRRVPARVTLPL
jgi:glycine cleavage system aminomethyltransferase T